MRNVPGPNNNDKVIYRQVTIRRRGPDRVVLKRIYDRVCRRYDSYWQARFALETLRNSSFSSSEKRALIKLYEKPLGEFHNIRIRLRSNLDVTHCPYCGLNEANELDHYVPKDLYPVFSIFSPNLIPICGHCNRDYKGGRFKKNGSRIFINPYYDRLPKARFLHADVFIDERMPIIRFEIDPASIRDRSLFRQIVRHFEELNLGDRFEREALTRISDEWNSLRRTFQQRGQRGVREALERTYRACRDRYGENHWEPALYRALSQCRQFCSLSFDPPT